jgi:hypothetical protein
MPVARSLTRDPLRLGVLAHRSWAPAGGLAAAAAVAVLLIVGNLGAQPSPALGEERAAACSPTPVHWKPRRNVGTRAGLVMPWIAATPARARVIGYLVYYAPGSPVVLVHLPGVVIYTEGRTPDNGATSIIWVPERNTGRYIYFRGQRLDGPGEFRQRSSFGSAGTYPSVLRVPTPGCWRVTLRGQNLLAHVTFRAVDARE